MKHIKTLRLLSAFLALVLLCGCGQRDPGGGQSTSEPQTAFAIPAFQDDQLAKAMAAQLREGRNQLLLRQQQLKPAFGSALEKKRRETATIAARLDAMSPLKVLARGYSITENDRGQAILSASELHPGDHITIRFHSGFAEAQVEETREESK